jgi:3-hydroxybutyryl-CoA dehydratase
MTITPASMGAVTGASRGPRPLRVAEIPEGARASFSKTITVADLAFYGGISGDFNPLHVNEEYARTTTVGGRLVYELVTAALLSTVLGRVAGPGFRWQRHVLEFPRPVHVGDTLVATAEVVGRWPETGVLRCRTECRNQRGEVVVEGSADLVSVLSP